MLFGVTVHINRGEISMNLKKMLGREGIERKGDRARGEIVFGEGISCMCFFFRFFD